MRPSSLLPALLSLLNLSSASPEPQLAQGGGLAATTLAATQYPIVTTVASLLTVGGTTSTTYIVYTQTFAATALGSYVIFKSISQLLFVFRFIWTDGFDQGALSPSSPNLILGRVCWNLEGYILTYVE